MFKFTNKKAAIVVCHFLFYNSLLLISGLKQNNAQKLFETKFL